MNAEEEARIEIYGDPNSSTFSVGHHSSLMATIEVWYESIEAKGLSHAGMAALLRAIADDFG